eukprot:SM000013S26448  [mRNA]  locus=s13:466472:467857:+ [translate_table: standard]
MNVERAQALKERGNIALARGDRRKALEHYSRALELVPNSHILYSNRSAAHFQLAQYKDAVADAQRCIQIAPSYVKGFGRLATALFALERYGESAAAYRKGLKLQQDNQIYRKGLIEAERMDKESRNRSFLSHGAVAAEVDETGSYAVSEHLPTATEFQVPSARSQAVCTKPYFTLAKVVSGDSGSDT